MNQKIKQILVCLPFLIVAMIIFSFSGETAEESTETSHTVIEILLEKCDADFSTMTPQAQEAKIQSLQTLVRKGAHAFAYMILGATAWIALHYVRLSRGQRMLLALGMSVLYAEFDEVHQIFVRGRSGQLSDVLIDTGGAAVGILLISLAAYGIHRIRKSVRKTV